MPSRATSPTDNGKGRESQERGFENCPFLFPSACNGKHTNTHACRCTCTCCEGSSVTALLQYRDFQVVIKCLLKKIPPFWKLLLLFWLPSCSSLVSHCATKMAFWAPRSCLTTQAASHPALQMATAGLKLKGKDTGDYQSREWDRNRKYKQSKSLKGEGLQPGNQQVLAFRRKFFSLDFNILNSKWKNWMKTCWMDWLGAESGCSCNREPGIMELLWYSSSKLYLLLKRKCSSLQLPAAWFMF